MYNPSTELQRAILLKLKPLGLKVYDTVPLGAVMPYFVIGEDVFTDNSLKTSRGTDHIFTIHGWASGTDRSQINLMQAQALEALVDADYALNGAIVLQSSLSLTQVMKDPSSTSSSSLYHLVLQMRYRVLST